MAAEAKPAQHSTHALRLETSLRELVHQVLNRVLIKRQSIDKVLVVAPNTQLVAAATLTRCGVEVTCRHADNGTGVEGMVDHMPG